MVLPTTRQIVPLWWSASRQPVDMDSVPICGSAGLSAWQCFCCSRRLRGRAAWLDQKIKKQLNKNKEKKAEKCTPSLELNSRWGHAALRPQPNHAHTCAHSPHRSNYKSDYANSGLREKPQPPSQCGNSVNKWSTKHKVLKERITKWLSFLSPLISRFFTQCPLHIHTHTHTQTETYTPTHIRTSTRGRAHALTAFQNSIAAQCLHRWAV